MKMSILVSLSMVAAGSIALGTVHQQLPAYACPAGLSAPASSSQNKESMQSRFRKDVLEATQPVLVDFYATWCGPCRKMAPVIDELSRVYGGKIKVVRIDVDKNPELATQYGIMSIPSIKLFKNGTVVDETLGVTPLAELREKVDRVL